MRWSWAATAAETGGGPVWPAPVVSGQQWPAAPGHPTLAAPETSTPHLTPPAGDHCH